MLRETLRTIADALERRRIPYMVIGGQAVLLYGEPRFTNDIDLTLGVEPTGLKTILDVVDEVGLRVLTENPEAFLAETLVLPCAIGEGELRVDFVFTYEHSEFERRALNRAQSVNVDGVDVKFISAEDLIVQKIVAGRARDLDDVKSILLRNPTIDAEHVEGELRKFERILSRPLVGRLAALRP